MGRRLRVNLQDIYERYIETVIEAAWHERSVPVQYFRWVSHLLQGDWGWSSVLRANVFDVLVDRIPATVELTLYSLLLFIPLGFFSGALAGWNRNRGSDHSFRLFAL